jgi:hypothetical protein
VPQGRRIGTGSPCLVKRAHGRPVRWREALCAAIFAAVLAGYFALAPVLAPALARADQAPTDFQVKAAYLFNFLKFVEWPENPGADPHAKWVIGFMGQTPIGEELAHMAAGKNVLGRDLEIKTLQASDNLRACNIVFISDSEKKRLPAILNALRGSTVLTVADMDDFIGAGGMVQFVVEDARVRLSIDLGAATRAHLKISSKLLLLAHVVGGAERGSTN